MEISSIEWAFGRKQSMQANPLSTKDNNNNNNGIVNKTIKNNYRDYIRPTLGA